LWGSHRSEHKLSYLTAFRNNLVPPSATWKTFSVSYTEIGFNTFRRSISSHLRDVIRAIMNS
jgi:hypothetical protein